MLNYISKLEKQSSLVFLDITCLGYFGRQLAVLLRIYTIVIMKVEPPSLTFKDKCYAVTMLLVAHTTSIGYNQLVMFMLYYNLIVEDKGFKALLINYQVIAKRNYSIHGTYPTSVSVDGVGSLKITPEIILPKSVVKDGVLTQFIVGDFNYSVFLVIFVIICLKYNFLIIIIGNVLYTIYTVNLQPVILIFGLSMYSWLYIIVSYLYEYYPYILL